MLHFILGRAKSGKTQLVREKLAESGGIIIVPEQFSFDTERALLERLGAAAMRKIEVLSFSRLAENMLNTHCPSGLPILNDNVRLILLELAVDYCKDKISFFNPDRFSASMSDNLLALDAELKSAGVTAEDFARVGDCLTEGYLKKKISESATILSCYDSLIRDKYEDTRTAIKRLADLLNREPLLADKTVYIDAFAGFTADEYEVITAILKQARDCFVTVCADSLRDKSEGLGVFSHPQRIIAALTDIAARHNIAISAITYLDNEDCYESGAVAHIERNIYSNKIEEYLGEDSEDICLITAETKLNECDIIAAECKRLVREEGLRYRDIAIIERNAGSYERELSAAFAKYSLPLFLDDRRSILTIPLISFALAAAEIAAKGFSTDAIMRYAASGLCCLTDEEIFEIDNYALMWELDYSAWTTEWKKNPCDFGSEDTNESRETLKRLNTNVKRLTGPLLTLRNRLKEAVSGLDCCKIMFDFLKANDIDEKLKELIERLDKNGCPTEAEDCIRSWDVLMDILSSMAEALGDKPCSTLRFYELFLKICSGTSIGDIPTALDRITLGNAKRIRTNAPKAVFIVGMLQGEFPLCSESKGIFSDNERRELKKHGLELTDIDDKRASAERYIVYSALTSPLKKLYLSCYAIDINGDKKMASDIFTAVGQLAPDCKRINAAELDDILYIESARAAFCRTAISYNRNDELSLALKNYFAQNDEYKDKLTALERINFNQEIEIKDKALAISLFKKDMYLTASRVESFYLCPFMYFCKFGLKAKPRAKAVINERINGLAVHYVLEKLFSTRAAAKELSAMTRAERSELVTEHLNFYVENYLGGQENQEKRLKYIINSYIVTIETIVERILFEFDNSDFTISDVELSIGYDDLIPPVRLPLKDGGSISISGVVDRVDTMPAKDGSTFVRIVDYKTGGKVFSLGDAKEGLSLQMLIYLFSIWENGMKKYGKVIPAGVLYVPAKIGDLSLSRNANEDEIQDAKIKNGKMNGLVLNDMEVIEGMEHEVRGRFIPVKIKKDGDISSDSSTISAVEMKLLKLHIDKLLTDMGSGLHEGKIDSMPTYTNKHENTCERCEYRSVCLNDPEKKRKEVSKIKDTEVYDFLRQEYQEGE